MDMDNVVDDALTSEVLFVGGPMDGQVLRLRRDMGKYQTLDGTYAIRKITVLLYVYRVAIFGYMSDMVVQRIQQSGLCPSGVASCVQGISGERPYIRVA